MRPPDEQTPGGNRASAEATAETASIIAAGSPVDKQIVTLQAKAALLGHELQVIRLANGRQYFEVRRAGQARMFSTIHGAQSFLSQVSGAAR